MIGSIKNALVRFFQPITSRQYFAGIRQFNNGNYKEAADNLFLIRQGVYNTSILYRKLTDFYYFRSLRNRALIDFYNADYLQCIINCKKALIVDPKDKVCLNYLAHSFHHVGQYSASINNLRDLYSIESDRVDVLVNLAKILLKADQMREGLDIVNYLISEHGEFADFFLMKGIASSKLGDSQEAISSYKDAIRINPSFAKGLLLLGLEYIRDFQYESAHEVFAHGVEVCPNDTELLFYYGLVGNIIQMLKKSGVLDDSVDLDSSKEFISDSLLNDLTYLDDTAVTERLNNLDLDISYGEHFTFLDPIYDKPCLERLSSVFHELIKEKPEYPDYKYKLASFYIKLSDLENAKKFLTEALLINPDYIDALNSLMTIHENEQDYIKADKVSTKILALRPDQAINHLNHGRIQLKMERFEEAARSMTTARHLDKRYNSHVYLLGFILKEHGVYGLARSVWSQLKSVYPAVNKEIKRLDKLEQKKSVA